MYLTIPGNIVQVSVHGIVDLYTKNRGISLGKTPGGNVVRSLQVVN